MHTFSSTGTNLLNQGCFAEKVAHTREKEVGGRGANVSVVRGMEAMQRCVPAVVA